MSEAAEAAGGRAWVAGEVVPLQAARVPFLDRGFLFGEAVYEGLHARNGRLFAADRHDQRLKRSAAGIGLQPEHFMGAVRAALKELLQAVSPRDGFVYIQVTGGTAPRQHLPPEPPPPENIYLSWTPTNLSAIRKLQREGVAAITAVDDRWGRATFKTTQLLANVLARRRARAQGASEVFFMTPGGELLEGAASNVFVVQEGGLVTPPLDRNILPGVTRELLVREWPGEVCEQPVEEALLREAAELFIVSTRNPVVPVRALDGRPRPTPLPGPVTRKVQAWLHQRMERELGPASSAGQAP